MASAAIVPVPVACGLCVLSDYTFVNIGAGPSVPLRELLS